MDNSHLSKVPFDWEKEEANCDLEQDYICERKKSDGNLSANSFSSPKCTKMHHSPLKYKGSMKISHRDQFIAELNQGTARTRRQRFQNGESIFYHRNTELFFNLKQMKKFEIKRNSDVSNEVQFLLSKAPASEDDSSQEFVQDPEYFESTINACIGQPDSANQPGRSEEQILVTMQDVSPGKRSSN